MPRKKVEKVEEVAVKPVKASVKTEVSVYDAKGNVVRTYSKEVHGDNFEKLAESFIADRANYSIK